MGESGFMEGESVIARYPSGFVLAFGSHLGLFLFQGFDFSLFFFARHQDA